MASSPKTSEISWFIAGSSKRQSRVGAPVLASRLARQIILPGPLISSERNSLMSMLPSSPHSIRSGMQEHCTLPHSYRVVFVSAVIVDDSLHSCRPQKNDSRCPIQNLVCGGFVSTSSLHFPSAGIAGELVLTWKLHSLLSLSQLNVTCGGRPGSMSVILELVTSHCWNDLRIVWPPA